MAIEVYSNWNGSGIDTTYNAVGFSDNDHMGNDTVLLFSPINGIGELYWNVEFNTVLIDEFSIPVGDNTGLTADDFATGVDEMWVSFTRDALLTFERPDPTNPGLEFNDISTTPYFTLIASGPMFRHNGSWWADEHVDRFFTPTEVDFTRLAF